MNAIHQHDPEALSFRSVLTRLRTYCQKLSLPSFLEDKVDWDARIHSQLKGFALHRRSLNHSSMATTRTQYPHPRYELGTARFGNSQLSPALSPALSHWQESL